MTNQGGSARNAGSKIQVYSFQTLLSPRPPLCKWAWRTLHEGAVWLPSDEAGTHSQPSAFRDRADTRQSFLHCPAHPTFSFTWCMDHSAKSQSCLVENFAFLTGKNNFSCLLFPFSFSPVILFLSFYLSLFSWCLTSKLCDFHETWPSFAKWPRHIFLKDGSDLAWVAHFSVVCVIFSFQNCWGQQTTVGRSQFHLTTFLSALLSFL